MEKWPYVGNILQGAVVHSPQITRAIWFRDALCVGCMSPSVVVSCLLWAWQVQLVVRLSCAKAASHWLVGPGHKVAGCRYLGVPRASTGSLVDRARFWGVSSKAGVPRSSAHLLMGKIRIQKFPGLVPDHWWMKPGPEASAGLLTDSSGS